MRFKKLFLALALTGVSLAQTSPSGTSLEGTVYQVESDAVYVMTPDTTAIKVPLSATFLVAGKPTPSGALHNGDRIRVEYAPEPIEIIAGPLPPSLQNPFYRRSIKRGALVLDQNFRDGVWVDAP